MRNPDRSLLPPDVDAEMLCDPDEDAMYAEVRTLSARWLVPLVWDRECRVVYPAGENVWVTAVVSPPTPAMKNDAAPGAPWDSARDVAAPA